MREMLPLVITLTLIAAVAGFALALVNSVTEEPIAKAEREATLRAIRTVLPPFDDDHLVSVTLGEGEEAREIFIARNTEGELVGFALVSVSKNGYGGDLEVMLGIMPEGDDFKIHKIEILRHAETPGLGTKVTQDKFKSQFEGVNYSNLTFAVKKDNPGSPDKPPIDGVTGATISSRAVTEAADAGLTYFLAEVKNIMAAEAAKSAEGGDEQ